MGGTRQWFDWMRRAADDQKKRMEEAMRVLSVFLIALAHAVTGGARAHGVADFNRGRQIQMIIGYGPGGG